MPHTQGPWKVINKDMVVGPEGQLVADCERTPHNQRPQPPSPEDMSNATLIASAPELLQIVKEFIQDYQEMGIGDKQTVLNAQAVLREAEGRS